MNPTEADKFVRAASLLFVLQGEISSKKSTFRLRQALTGQPNGRKKSRVDAAPKRAR